MYPPQSVIGPAAKRDWLLVLLNILIPCALVIFIPLTYVAATATGAMFCGGLSLMLLASLGIINIRVTRLVRGLPFLVILLMGFIMVMIALQQMPKG